MEDSMEVKEDEEERGERVKVNIEDGCEDNMCDNQELMGYDDEDPIFQEFTDWKVEPCSSSVPDKVIDLVRITRDPEEGKTSLLLNIHPDPSTSHQCTLHCPSNYPIYRGEEENFFLEAPPSLMSWCNSVNEFILDRQNLSLSEILTKSLSLYRKNMTTTNNVDSEYESGSDSDDSYVGIEEDGQLDDCLDKWGMEVVEIARRKKRWRDKEKELRAKCKDDNNCDKNRDLSLQEVYHESTLRFSQLKQVFTSEGASGILINDLVSIMGESQALGIRADTVDDNIFQWNVKFCNFSGTPLHDDLKLIEKRFGYHYIELQLDFSKDLYPFFPPLVKVIRPRLQGSMMLRVTTMEILKLTYWNPARDMKTVIKEIQEFLSTWARLEVGSERNDRARYPMGAYNSIEHHLLRLALVSEIVPRANNKYRVAEIPEAVKLPLSAVESRFDSKHKKKEIQSKQNKWCNMLSTTSTTNSTTSKPPKPGTTGGTAAGGKKSSTGGENSSPPTPKMAKGVGYSSYNHKGWDIDSYLAAQQEKDKQIELVLVNILTELKRLNHNNTINNHNATISNSYSGANSMSNHTADNSSRRKRKLSPADLEKTGGGSVIHAAHDNSAAASDKLTDSTDPMVSQGLNAVASIHLDPDTKHAAEPVNPVDDLYSVLEGSAIIPYIESKLQANSFLEIGQHIGVYRQVVGIIREMCHQPSLRSLLAPLPDQHTSIQELLHNLEQQANIMIQRIGKASANGSVPKDKKKSSGSSQHAHGHHSGAHHGKGGLHGGGHSCERVDADTTGRTLSVTEGSDILAREFQKLSKEVGEAVKYCAQNHGQRAASPMECTTALGDSSALVTSNGHVSPEPMKPSHSNNQQVPDVNDCQPRQSDVDRGASSSPAESHSLEQEYCSALLHAQFDNIEFEESGPSKHFFQSEFAKTESPPYQSIIRVAQDIASLHSKGALPLNPSSSIFVRSDENKTTLLRCIITGPEGTPYTGGIYEFDIYFPNKYPSVPPKVHFRTTGGGTVRFNPNLYKEGKVCLSLLGTWDGAQGEQWNQHTSTILQVLISIQSLILCPEPYYNEPGYERQYGTEVGQNECANYNEGVLKNNLKFAISDAIKCPPVGFEDVVSVHFYLKKRQLIKEIEQMSEGKSKSLKKIAAEVISELKNIQKPKALTKK